MPRGKGHLVVISGPSGVGKTTVVRRLLERAGFVKSISATTRKPRPGEKHGRDYLFLTRGQFRRRRFLEHAEVHGERYGTPLAPILEHTRADRVVLLDIDVQGARAIRRCRYPATTVFLLPPDRAQWLRRLRGRGTEDAAALGRRIRTAKAELRAAPQYDIRVVNDSVEGAARRILAHLRRRGVLG